MNTLLKWIGGIVLLLFSYNFIKGFAEGYSNAKERHETTEQSVVVTPEQKNNQTQTTQLPPATDKVGYELNNKEKFFIDITFQIQDDSFISGENSNLMFGQPILKTSSVEISKTYDENQVNGDNKFYKKDILFVGVIKEIVSGINNEPYVVTNSGQFIANPDLHFDDQYRDEIATLRKGQNLVAVCKGNGIVAGTPMLDHCILAKQYVKNTSEERRHKLQDFLNGGDLAISDRDSISRILVAMIMGNYLPDQSKCLNVDIKKLLAEPEVGNIKNAMYQSCRKDFFAAQKSVDVKKDAMKEMLPILYNLHKNGVKIVQMLDGKSRINMINELKEYGAKYKDKDS